MNMSQTNIYSDVMVLICGEYLLITTNRMKLTSALSLIIHLEIKQRILIGMSVRYQPNPCRKTYGPVVTLCDSLAPVEWRNESV